MLECFDDDNDLEEQITKVQELIDNREAEGKERKAEDEDEDYQEGSEVGDEFEEIDEDYEEEQEEEGDDMTLSSTSSSTSSVGKKRRQSILRSSDGKTVALSRKRMKQSKAANITPMKESNEYEKMTMTELKEICRSKNLSVGGRKADLVQKCKTGAEVSGKSWSDSCQIA